MLIRCCALALVLLSAITCLQAQPHPEWRKNHAPFRIIGNLYYVGSEDLAAYLVTTPQGHILLNENLATSAPQICQNIATLGFKPQDVKVLLNSQTHYDHTGGLAAFKRATHAQVAVMDADVATLQSGGRDDFFFFNDSSAWFEPVKVDRVLHDGSQVKLGQTVLTARLTPGHTKGTTTWTLDLPEAGRVRHVVIVGGAGFNDGNNLVNDPRYPTQAQDFEKTFRTLRALPCDVFLGAHGVYFDLLGKYARRQSAKANPFIDPAGYRAFIAEREQVFRTELARQTAHR